jgi:hypothetical protein
LHQIYQLLFVSFTYILEWRKYLIIIICLLQRDLKKSVKKKNQFKSYKDEYGQPFKKKGVYGLYAPLAHNMFFCH